MSDMNRNVSAKGVPGASLSSARDEIGDVSYRQVPPSTQNQPCLLAIVSWRSCASLLTGSTIKLKSHIALFKGTILTFGDIRLV